MKRSDFINGITSFLLYNQELIAFADRDTLNSTAEQLLDIIESKGMAPPEVETSFVGGYDFNDKPLYVATKRREWKPENE